MTTSTPEIRAQLLAIMPRLRRFMFVVTGSLPAADELLAEMSKHILAGKCGRLPDENAEQWMFTLATMIWNQALVSAQPESRVRALNLSGDLGSKMRLDKGGSCELPVADAIVELPPERRAILALVCVEGFSYIEAAGILGISIESLKDGLVDARLVISRAMVCEREYAQSVIANGERANSPIGQIDRRSASERSSVSTPLPGTSEVGHFFWSQAQQ